MNLPKYSVERPVTVAMQIMGVLILGLIALTRLPQELFPPITFPQITVVTEYFNAAPEEIESLITKPIEEAVGSVSGLRKLESVSREGKSIVSLSFNWGIDVDFAALAVREKIDLVKEKLPKEAEDPMVLKFNPLARPILILSLTGKIPPADLKLIADKTLKDNLEKVEGVASATVSGGLDREILVELDQGRLQASGISVLSVVEALEKANLSYPAGSIKKGLYEYMIRTVGEFQSVDEIGFAVAGVDEGKDRRHFRKELFVERDQFGSRGTLAGTREEAVEERIKKRLILFRELGQIKDTFKEKTSVSRYCGEDNISISIQKQAGANTIQVVDNVKKLLSYLQEEFDSRQVKVQIIYDHSYFIRQALAGVRDAAWQGALLSFIVLYFFLRSVTSSFIIMLVTPISIMAVFFLMYIKGITLNIMSLGGLALGVGMLVDNSVVLLENIFRLRQLGEKPVPAAIKGANEVMWPIFSSTLTTIAVFFPLILFVPGIPGQLFKDLSWTVVLSQGISLYIAVILVPLMATFIRLPQGTDKVPDYLLTPGKRGSYLLSLTPKAQNKIFRRLIYIVTGVFLLSLFVMTRLDRELMPKTDQGQFMIKVDMPLGTKLERTNEITTVVEKAILDIPEVKDTAVSIGSSESAGAESGVEALRSSQAQVLVSLKGKRKKSSWQVVDELKDKLSKFDLGQAQIEYIVQESEFQFMGGGGGKPVSIEIQGYDFKVLEDIVKRIRGMLTEIPGIFDVQDDRSKPHPETKVEIDRKKAALYGVSVEDISLTVKAAIDGAVATQFKEGGREFDIRVCLREEDRSNVLKLGDLLIRSAVLNAEIPLREVATVVQGEGPSEIKRFDQERTIIVSANTDADVNKRRLLEEVAMRLQAMRNEIPEGYSVEISGEAREIRESFQKVIFALVLSLVLVYMIMASQFESFMQPFVIMFTVPLSIIGAAFGLVVARQTLNVISMLGIIMLGGIVVNNGIVLIEYINQMRDEGKELVESCIMASRIRRRPILMTALTSVFGLLPLALGFGEGGALRAPLAVTVMGGLISATFLTLNVVPAIYILVTRAMDYFFRLIYGAEPEEETGEKTPEQK
ncbi:MAG: efflux RND transporter permease subunit [Candidatus Omnitrophica bacterium]|nr:efflux RND transporter permease subunit [Candidatus Omnitrophota bacterium]